MNFINNLIFGNQNDNNNQNNNQNNDENFENATPQINKYFKDMLRVYPSYFFERNDLENGNKILLPSQCLDKLTKNEMPKSMIFKIDTLRSKETFFVGVKEFVAPEDSLIMPFWLFEQLKLKEGEMVKWGLIENLPKAKLAKIRPHKTEFINLPDPKEILEKQMNNFVCLQEGKTISINYFEKAFLIDIVSMEPKNEFDTCLIYDTDLNIEFEAPLDYVEPPKPVKNEVEKKGGVRWDGEEINYDEIENTFDPRQHKIIHGIRNDFEVQKSFQGRGFILGG